MSRLTPNMARNIAVWMGVVCASLIIADVLTARAAKRASVLPLPTSLATLESQNTERVRRVGMIERALAEPQTQSEEVSALRAEKRALSTEIKAGAKAILSADPLSDQAFNNLVVADLIDNNAITQPAVLDEAFARKPRNRKTSYLVLNTAQQRGDIKTMVDMTDLLYRLNPNRWSDYDAVLSELYETAEGRALIEARLSEPNYWADPLMRRKIRDAQPDALLSLAPAVKTLARSKPKPKDSFPLQYAFYDRLVRAGQPQAAYDAWRSIRSDAAAQYDAPGALIYNPNFAPDAAAAPFNWSVFTRPQSFAEIDPRGGLYLSFGSEAAQPLARQTILPPPDAALRLSIEAAFGYTKRQGYFELRYRCLNPRQSHVIYRLDDRNKKGRQTVSIPAFDAPCPLADITIWGQPGVFAERISATLTHLSIAPDATNKAER